MFSMSGCSLRNLARVMLLALFVLLISSESYARRSAACSLEFALVGSKCYYFSKEETNWGDAYYQCLSKNSSLAILKTSKEDRQIRSYMKHNSQSLGKSNRWIGGKFDWKNEKWVWAETGQPILLKTFLKTVPIDKRFLQWTCIIVDSSKMNKWSFKSCLQPNHFICQKKPKRSIRPKNFDIRICKRNVNQLTEIQRNKCLKLVGGYGGMKFANIPAPIIQTPKPTAKNMKEYVCPSNMLVIRNRCYYFSHDELNWNDAYWACRDNKTYLATIHSKYQDKLLGEFLNSGLAGNHERWLGGLYDWKQKHWLWANSGTPLKYQGFPFKNYTGSQFEWRSITVDPNIGNMWNSRLRTELKHYICQKRAKTIAKLGDFNTDESAVQSVLTPKSNIATNKIT